MDRFCGDIDIRGGFQSRTYLCFYKSYLVLIGHAAKGGDQDPRNTCVPVPRRRVQRRIPVLKFRKKNLFPPISTCYTKRGVIKACRPRRSYFLTAVKKALKGELRERRRKKQEREERERKLAYYSRCFEGRDCNRPAGARGSFGCVHFGRRGGAARIQRDSSRARAHVGSPEPWPGRPRSCCNLATMPRAKLNFHAGTRFDSR